jgi:YebC/PmpR family DNA-binding regulatory protein
MSGHSKWSTIKIKKEATDIAKGKLFSKLSRAISIAVKTGGGSDPDANSKLRMAIDTARAANMPKSNIERAIERASKEGEFVEEVEYEGYGPSGISVIVEAATDNRNRTGQEIKNIFERGGGSLAGPGAVSYNFDSKGLLVIDKPKDVEESMLKLIDLGAEDVEEESDAIEIYVPAAKLHEVSENLKSQGFVVKSASIVSRPKTLSSISDETKAKKALDFLDNLEEHDDVQKVFTNLDIPDEVLSKVS